MVLPIRSLPIVGALLAFPAAPALADVRFANQAEGLAFADLEADAVDGAHFAFRREKRSLEIFNLD